MSSSDWVGISGMAVRPPILRIPSSLSTPKPYAILTTTLISKIVNLRKRTKAPFRPNRPIEWWALTLAPEEDLEDVETTTMEGESDGEDGETNSFDAGDIAYILASTALVFLMIPALGFFYSGLARTKSALSLIMLCSWSIALVSIQWFVFGYSLTFSKTASSFIGNFDNLFLQGVYDSPSIIGDKIPALVFCIYQGMFAAITPALAIGAAAERNRFLPTTIFILLWTTFVYDFIACWTWNPNGWSAMLGGLDFAGGTPVHISSGAAALAYAIVIGKREKAYRNENFHPHNMANVFLGTALLWFGWLGFNGGSALAASQQAINACVATNLSASMGGIIWVILDYRHERKYSPLGFCSGAVAGLVCITPACGYVSPASSLVFGIAGAIFCHIAVSVKNGLFYDDAVDVFAVHGVGGIVGNILTGVFAQKSYADGIEGGGLDGHWIQVWHQVIDTVAGFSWSFIISLIILVILNIIPGCRLRVGKEAERAGVDISQLGQNCYDFVEDLKLATAKNLDDNLVKMQFGPWFDPTSEDLNFSNMYGLPKAPGRKFDYGVHAQLSQIYPYPTTVQLPPPIIQPPKALLAPPRPPPPRFHFPFSKTEKPPDYVESLETPQNPTVQPPPVPFRFHFPFSKRQMPTDIKNLENPPHPDVKNFEIQQNLFFA